MRFSVTQENLNRGLNIVSHVAGKNSALPILSNVLIEAEKGVIKMSTTNLEIGLSCLIRGKVEVAGKYTVEAKLLADYINLIKAERLDVFLEDDNLEIRGEDTQTKIKGMSSEEFPLIPELEKKEMVSCGTREFKKALNQVIFAVATDESRLELSGIYFSFREKLILVATDSYRLAEKKIELKKGLNEEKKMIVPVRTMQELSRILDESDEELNIYLGENQILFTFGEVALISRLIEGQYPDYSQIIPTDFQTEIEMETSSLVRNIKTASLFCKPGINDVNLTFVPEKGEIVTTAINSQVGENISRIPAKIKGKDNDIVFNYRYLLDGLQNINKGEVVLEITSSQAPGLLKAKNDLSYLYLIMPIKQ